MISALDSGSIGPDWNPGQGYCAEDLVKRHLSDSAYHLGKLMSSDRNPLYVVG